MAALEILTGFVTGVIADFTSLTMANGNSLTIRNTPEGANITLLNTWVQREAVGLPSTIRIRSPFLHDNVQGIRLIGTPDDPFPLLPLFSRIPLVAQDTLVAEINTGAGAGQISTMSLLIHYSDLFGVDADFRTAEDVIGNIIHMLAVENTITADTAGGYSGEEALNADFDLLKANTFYAILGYICTVPTASVRYRASAWGNLGLGGPGNSEDPDVTANWFVRLSQQTGIPLIPVFNSADIDNVLIDVAQDDGGADPTINTILAELPS